MNPIFKWTHSDGVRQLCFDSTETFASSLDKMKKKVATFRDTKYFYTDGDGDQIIVDDNASFMMMLEFFKNIPVNQTRRIQTCPQVDRENEHQHHQNDDEDSDSSTTDSGAMDFDDVEESDGNEKAEKNSNVKDKQNRLKIVDELQSLVDNIEANKGELEQMAKDSQSLSIEFNKLNARCAELLPPTKFILDSFHLNPDAQYEIVGFYRENKARLMQLLKDIRAVLIAKKGMSTFVNVKAAKSKRKNVRVAGLNNFRGGEARSMHADICVDANRSEDGDITVCDINNWTMAGFSKKKK